MIMLLSIPNLLGKIKPLLKTIQNRVVLATPTVVDEGEEKLCKEMHHRNEELSLPLDLPPCFVLYSLYVQRVNVRT